MKKLIDEMLEAKKLFLSKVAEVDKTGVHVCGMPDGTHLHLERTDNPWELARKLGVDRVKEGDMNGNVQTYFFIYNGEKFFWLA